MESIIDMSIVEKAKRLFTPKKKRLLADLQMYVFMGCGDDIINGTRPEFERYVNQVKAQNPEATTIELIALVESALSK